MTTGESSAPASWLQRLVDVRPHELAAVAWSWLFFFAVLSAYYVIRPIRDDMGVAGGVNNLPWLFTGSLTGMLLANPPLRIWWRGCHGRASYRGPAEAGNRHL